MSLKAWREIIHPHKDVASGRYLQAEFMANLADVLSGKPKAEYGDPAEFFSRTYFTGGMTKLIGEALLRLSGEGGEPVVQLKTAFGGGKTHTMLALYHLLKAGKKAMKMEGVAKALAEVGREEVPAAKVAVLVGTALSATQAHPDMAGNGVTVRTLWGEMAAQLGGQQGYDLVAADDLAGTAPDSTTLGALFEQVGPCLILADEMVAFIRNLYQLSEATPAGSFDANLYFVQSLTEAAKSSPRVMLVASIPESKVEVGGEGGQAVLAHLEQVFGRVESVWRAADAGEGFEIVRRRLFQPVRDEAGREEACRAFHKLYCDNPADFPAETQAAQYLDRLRSAYPVHPEVFDRLYGDWSTLERFQRTRGVLRLLSTVIHRLWTDNDQSAMILPGTIPMDADEVRTELLKYLPDGWTAVVETDVDGANSEPLRIDQSNPRFGQIAAARKVARTIFLGSAPSVAGQQVRGLDDVRVRLGVAQPGDNLPLFRDALGRLQDRLTYLYFGSGRYWYDTRPNLRKTMEDRAARITEDEVEAELERLLKRDHVRGDFRGVHFCSTSTDIPDEQEVRLVVLCPDATHKRGEQRSKALAAAADILQQRGGIPRQHQNMLLFAAADESIKELLPEVKRLLAWRSIVQDHDALNLDAHQRREASQGQNRSQDTVDVRLPQAYRWLLVPTQEGTGPVVWEANDMPGSESIVTRASQKAKSSGHLITSWGAALLKMELDRWLWGEEPHINTQKLWGYLTDYLYLPRLQDQAVLAACIREGMRNEEWFGYAASVDENGRYEGLQFGAGFAAVRIDSASVIVKPEAAKAQLEADKKPEPGPEVKIDSGEERLPDGGRTRPHAPTHFIGTIVLDSSRILGDTEKVANEVIQHLVRLMGSNVTVRLDIDARVPDGIPQDVVRTVDENCKVLRFEQKEFEF